jgi:hypothetical protein
MLTYVEHCDVETGVLNCYVGVAYRKACRLLDVHTGHTFHAVILFIMGLLDKSM